MWHSRSATTTLVLFGRGRWTPGRRLRTVDGHRGSGLGWPCGNGLMGFGHGIARHGWRPGATRVASSSARPGRRRRPGWHVGAAAPDTFGTAFVVYGWSSCVAWATRSLLRAALWLVSERGMSERRLRLWWCVFVRRRFGIVWTMRPRCLCGFSDAVFLINCVALYGFWARFPYKLGHRSS